MTLRRATPVPWGAALLAAAWAAVLPGCSLLDSLTETILDSVADDPQSVEGPVAEGAVDPAELALAVDHWCAGLQQSRVVIELPEHCPRLAVAGVAWRAGEGPGPEAVVELLERRLAASGAWTVVGHADVTASRAVEEFAADPGDALPPAGRAALRDHHEVCYAVHGRVADRVVEGGGRARARPYLFLRVTDCRTGRVVFADQVDLVRGDERG